MKNLLSLTLFIILLLTAPAQADTPNTNAHNRGYCWHQQRCLEQAEMLNTWAFGGLIKVLN